MRVEHLPEKLKPAEFGLARVHAFRLLHRIAGDKDLAIDFEVPADISDEALRKIVGRLSGQLISVEIWLLQKAGQSVR